jgi:hypothetical protein
MRLLPTVEFEITWAALGGPELEKEYQFAPPRKWRADYTHHPSHTLIEIEGGIWKQGRHNRPAGFTADCEKYNAAALRGWTVFRLTSDMIDDVHIIPLVSYCKVESLPLDTPDNP